MTFIQTCNLPGYVLVQPIPIEIEQEDDGSYLISDTVFNEYGEGDTLEAARQDYLLSLAGYYQILKGYATPENVPSQMQFAQLRAYFVEVDA